MNRGSEPMQCTARLGAVWSNGLANGNGPDGTVRPP